jgi:hypothetical protein
MSRRQRHLAPRHMGAIVAYDARYISGVSNGSPVDQWSDRSGNSKHALGTGTQRPTMESVSVGGQPSLIFDGTDDRLTASTAWTDGGSLSIVALSLRSGAGNFGRIIDATVRILFYNQAAGFLRYTSTAVNSDFLSGSDTIGVWRIASVSHSSGSAPLLRVNGAASGSPGAVSNIAVSNLDLYIGNRLTSDRGIDGKIACIVGFPVALSLPLLRRLEQSIAASFKIACS